MPQQNDIFTRCDTKHLARSEQGQRSFAQSFTMWEETIIYGRFAALYEARKYFFFQILIKEFSLRFQA